MELNRSSYKLFVLLLISLFVTITMFTFNVNLLTIYKVPDAFSENQKLQEIEKHFSLCSSASASIKCEACKSNCSKPKKPDSKHQKRSIGRRMTRAIKHHHSHSHAHSGPASYSYSHAAINPNSHQIQSRVRISDRKNMPGEEYYRHPAQDHEGPYSKNIVQLAAKSKEITDQIEDELFPDSEMPQDEPSYNTESRGGHRTGIDTGNYQQHRPKNPRYDYAKHSGNYGDSRRAPFNPHAANEYMDKARKNIPEFSDYSDSEYSVPNEVPIREKSWADSPKPIRSQFSKKLRGSRSQTKRPRRKKPVFTSTRTPCRQPTTRETEPPKVREKPYKPLTTSNQLFSKKKKGRGLQGEVTSTNLPSSSTDTYLGTTTNSPSKAPKEAKNKLSPDKSTTLGPRKSSTSSANKPPTSFSPERSSKGNLKTSTKAPADLRTKSEPLTSTIEPPDEAMGSTKVPCRTREFHPTAPSKTSPTKLKSATSPSSIPPSVDADSPKPCKSRPEVKITPEAPEIRSGDSYSLEVTSERASTGKAAFRNLTTTPSSLTTKKPGALQQKSSKKPRENPAKKTSKPKASSTKKPKDEPPDEVPDDNITTRKLPCKNRSPQTNSDATMPQNGKDPNENQVEPSIGAKANEDLNPSDGERSGETPIAESVENTEIPDSGVTTTIGYKSTKETTVKPSRKGSPSTTSKHARSSTTKSGLLPKGSKQTSTQTPPKEQTRPSDEGTSLKTPCRRRVAKDDNMEQDDGIMQRETPHVSITTPTNSKFTEGTQSVTDSFPGGDESLPIPAVKEPSKGKTPGGSKSRGGTTPASRSTGAPTATKNIPSLRAATAPSESTRKLSDEAIENTKVPYKSQMTSLEPFQTPSTRLLPSKSSGSNSDSAEEVLLESISTTNVPCRKPGAKPLNEKTKTTLKPGFKSKAVTTLFPSSLSTEPGKLRSTSKPTGNPVDSENLRMTTLKSLKLSTTMRVRSTIGMFVSTPRSGNPTTSVPGKSRLPGRTTTTTVNDDDAESEEEVQRGIMTTTEVPDSNTTPKTSEETTKQPSKPDKKATTRNSMASSTKTGSVRQSSTMPNENSLESSTEPTTNRNLNEIEQETSKDPLIDDATSKQPCRQIKKSLSGSFKHNPTENKLVESSTPLHVHTTSAIDISSDMPLKPDLSTDLDDDTEISTPGVITKSTKAYNPTKAGKVTSKSSTTRRIRSTSTRPVDAEKQSTSTNPSLRTSSKSTNPTLTNSPETIDSVSTAKVPCRQRHSPQNTDETDQILENNIEITTIPAPPTTKTKVPEKVKTTTKQQSQISTTRLPRTSSTVPYATSSLSNDHQELEEDVPPESGNHATTKHDDNTKKPSKLGLKPTPVIPPSSAKTSTTANLLRELKMSTESTVESTVETTANAEFTQNINEASEEPPIAASDGGELTTTTTNKKPCRKRNFPVTSAFDDYSQSDGNQLRSTKPIMNEKSKVPLKQDGDTSADENDNIGMDKPVTIMTVIYKRTKIKPATIQTTVQPSKNRSLPGFSTIKTPAPISSTTSGHSQKPTKKPASKTTTNPPRPSTSTIKVPCLQREPHPSKPTPTQPTREDKYR